jgi:hypothetical protein
MVARSASQRRAADSTRACSTVCKLKTGAEAEGILQAASDDAVDHTDLRRSGLPPAVRAGTDKNPIDGNARRSRDTLIIARTDAAAVHGIDAAIERALLYRDAGADVLFVEAPRTKLDLKRIPSALGGAVVMANMVEGGKTPLLAAAELQELGFALVIFPGGIVRALAPVAREYYASLATHGSSEPFRNRMLDFAGLNELIGTPELLALGNATKLDRPTQDIAGRSVGSKAPTIG